MSCLVVSSQEYRLLFHKDFLLEIVEADEYGIQNQELKI